MKELEDLELFQKHVNGCFTELLSSSTHDGSSDNLLHVGWIRKLLDVFLYYEAEFKAIIFMGRDSAQIAKPPLDRLISEYLDRTVKALDICNATTQGVECIRHWQRLAQIAVSSLEQSPIGEGQVRRARKALTTLLASVTFEEKETNNNRSTERNWSFGRRCGSTVTIKDGNAGISRSSSWSVSKSWSAAKQIQGMMTNLVMPRGGESAGLAMPVYIMNTVLIFVMWALVAAIPCQERSGLSSHFPVQRQLSWAHSLMSVQEKVAEEWKKKEKKGSAGLLEEMQRMEKSAQSLIEFGDSSQFTAEKAEEVAAQVAELSEACLKMEEGLEPLQRQIREVFHTVVRSRAEVLDALDQATKFSSQIP